MDMKKIKRFVLLLIMAFLAVNVQAQLEQAVKNIFAGDTIATHPVPLHRDSDSVRVANLQKRWKRHVSMKQTCVWRWKK